MQYSRSQIFAKHRSVFNAFYRQKETKYNWRKFALPPSCSYIYSHTRNFLKRRRFTNEFLRYCDLKNFDGKTWSPLLSTIKTFRCDNFLETLKSSQWKFSALCVETNSTGKRDIPSHPNKFFATGIFSKHWRAPHETFRYYESKQNRRENLISPVASLSILAARSLLKQRRVPKEIFRNSDAENLRQKNVITPSLIHAIFPLPELLWNTEVFPLHFLGKRWQKILDGNLDYPRLVHILLPIPESFWNHEDFPLNFSGTMIQNNSTEKRDIPFSHPYQLFASRKFWKHWRVPKIVCGKVRREKLTAKVDIPSCIHITFSLPEIFWNKEEFSMNLSVNWTKKVWRNFATTSVFSIFLFPCEKISETPKDFPKKLFASVRPKIIDGRTWYPLSIQEMFSLPEALWKMELNPKKVMVMWDKKSQPKNLISPSLIHTNFSLPESFGNTEEFPKKICGKVRREKLTAKRDIPSWIHKTFSVPEISWNNEEFSMNLSVNWNKKVWRNFATTSVFSIFLFPCQKISETPKEFQNKLFDSVRPNIFGGRTWYPLSIKGMFSLPEALWKMELNPKKVYGNVR